MNYNDENEKSPEYYTFEFKDNLLYLYKAKDIGKPYELKLKKESQPFLVLKPIRKSISLAPRSLLTSEHAEFYHKYPGGKDLSQIEQIIQISKAYELSEEGFTLYQSKKDSLALKKYEEALAYYATGEIYYRYGNSLSNIPQLEDAIKAYKIASDLKCDKSYLIYYNIACAYSRMNDSKNAFSYLELAINNGYQNIDHIQKDSDLTFLRSQPGWQEWLAKHQE